MSYPSFKAVLKHVRRSLTEDKYDTRYICINIKYVLEDVYNIKAESVLLKRYSKIIEKQIPNKTSNLRTYERWVRDYHSAAYYNMTYKDFRQGRLQWIDHMLTRKDL
jgi:hypothetical protein